MCTNDSCDASGACVHTPITCNDGAACTDDTCHPFKGCVAETRPCAATSNCSLDYCDDQDGSPVCIQRNVNCVDNLMIVGASVGAALGGAAIAGIVVAIIVFVGLAGGGSYAAMKRFGNGGVDSISNNPLYKGDGNAGTNPLHHERY